MDDMTKYLEFTSPSFPTSATTLSNVEEYNSTSHHKSGNNKSCKTTPTNLPQIQADAITQRVNDNSQLNFAISSVVPQEIIELIPTLCMSPEITASLENKLEQLLPVTKENDQSTISKPKSEEIKDSINVSFPFPGNGSDITAPYNETDQVNHVILPILSSERCNSPISDKAAPSAQANSSDFILLVPNKSSPIISLMSNEDTNPMTSTDIPNTDTHLKNPYFAPKSELDEKTYGCFPDVDIMVAPSTTYENAYTTLISKTDQDVHGIISVSPPDKNIQYFASLPVHVQTTELNTSVSAVRNSIHSFTAIPLTNMNSNMDHSLCTTSLPEMKTPPSEAQKSEVTAKETKRSIHSIRTYSNNQSSEPPMLNDTLIEKENKREQIFNPGQGEEATVDSGDHHVEFCQISERLHKCVTEIRNLLITKGYHSLTDALTEGIQDVSEEGLSTNLTQLENFPTVLQSLLHNITRKITEHEELTDEHPPDSLIRNEEDRNKIDSSLPVKDTEESQKCHGLLDTSRMMSKYRMLSQDRLRCLVWGYVQYISWNRAENLLRRQCLSRPQITPALYKLQKQKNQAFLQWKDKILQSQEQRLRLSAVLNQTFQKVHEDTGIFLIKPLISWAGSSVLETRKQINSNIKPVRHSSLPPLWQDGISCRGISTSHVTKKWKYMHTHTEMRPLVVTPKLLEMDIHRYLCKECCVVSQLRDSLRGLPLKKVFTQKNIAHVKWTAPFPAQ
ncbi:uncharacterized protein LOC142748045 [Rhinoderma darwinii]|uniref:uncharacterized protein LOC142748045 n=1 Tax=Rhinoderma darwinii TaxID=43563 RepID=UPI003F678ADA